MAYVSADLMNEARANVKKVLNEYGVKGTLSGKGSSTIRLKPTSGKIDFAKDLLSKDLSNERLLSGSKVNVYHYDKYFQGVSRKFLKEVIEALKTSQYFDESDISKDYFFCIYYIDIQLGKYDKPY